jgi:predicted component of type VI protein secretion system
MDTLQDTITALADLPRRLRDHLLSPGFDEALRRTHAARSGISDQLLPVDERHLNDLEALFRRLNDSLHDILLESLTIELPGHSISYLLMANIMAPVRRMTALLQDGVQGCLEKILGHGGPLAFTLGEECRKLEAVRLALANRE